MRSLRAAPVSESIGPRPIRISTFAALTEELEQPGKGKLDAYLKPFIRKGSQIKDIADAIKAAPGLDGGEADSVADETNDPTVKAQYEAQEVKRKGGQGAAGKDSLRQLEVPTCPRTSNPRPQIPSQ